MEVKGLQPTCQPYTVAMVIPATELVIAIIRQLPIQHLLKSHHPSTTCIHHRTSNLHMGLGPKVINGNMGSPHNPKGTVDLAPRKSVMGEN